MRKKFAAAFLVLLTFVGGSVVTGSGVATAKDSGWGPV